MSPAQIAAAEAAFPGITTRQGHRTELPPELLGQGFVHNPALGPFPQAVGLDQTALVRYAGGSLADSPLGFVNSVLAGANTQIRTALAAATVGARTMAVDWGNVLQAGFNALGQWGVARSQARAARYQVPMMPYYPPQTGGGYLPAPSYPYPAPQPGALPPELTPAAYYPVSNLPDPNSVGGPSTAGLGGPVLAAGAALARRALPALIARLRAIFPTAAEASVVAMATTLIANGIGHDSAGPYAKASDNKVMGIMRGDLKAIKRVRRMGPKLTRALRSAGYGRARGGRKATRARTRTRTRTVVALPSHAHVH